MAVGGGAYKEKGKMANQQKLSRPEKGGEKEKYVIWLWKKLKK